MLLRLFLAVFLLASPLRADVLIFAASSLKPALDEVLEGQPVRVSYGGSGTLARQILQGAPADIFFSANPKWMDAVAPKARIDLLANTLVVIGEGSFDNMLTRDAKVATGLTHSVPVGIYAKATLERMGHWASIVPRLIETDSARAALVLVARGEVPYGIVYRTDALSADVQVVAELPSFDDMPILYPVALTQAARTDAADILALLQSEAARTVFTKYGFTAL